MVWYRLTRCMYILHDGITRMLKREKRFLKIIVMHFFLGNHIIFITDSFFYNVHVPQFGTAYTHLSKGHYNHHRSRWITKHITNYMIFWMVRHDIKRTKIYITSLLRTPYLLRY